LLKIDNNIREVALRVGDTVRVKPHITDPDLGVDIGGWQGRIIEVIPQERCVNIEWDSITLSNLPSTVITQCEEQGLDWSQMSLDMEDVELAPARDTNADVTRVVQQLQSEHGWDALGEEGRRIAQVLAVIASDNEWAQFKAWEAHLHKVLQFPFGAKVAESQERGPLRAGDQVTVQRITDVDDFYGILVRIKHKRGTSDFPLCDLAASDKASSNGVHVQDYAVWFANR
jgi:Calcium binding